MSLVAGQDIQEADRLMEAGQKDEAKAILQQLIAQAPDDKGTYADAVAIYLAGQMYDEAKALFQQYTQATGKNLENWGGSDFRLKDIEAEQIAQLSQPKAGMTGSPSPSTIGTPAFTLRPIDIPAVIFNVAFFGLGGLFMYWSITQDFVLWLRVAAPLMSLMFFYAGTIQALSYIRLDNVGLTAFQTWSKSTRPRDFRRTFALPHRRTIAFNGIANISIRMVSVGRGITEVMIINMKDKSQTVLGMGPYRKKDGQQLVMWLRQRGVDVDVEFGLLGKGY